MSGCSSIVGCDELLAKWQCAPILDLILRSCALARRLEGWKQALVAHPSRRRQEAAPLATTAKPLRGDEVEFFGLAVHQH
jgi:hypothetical protein